MKPGGHFLPAIDDEHHVGCENKRNSVPLDIAKHLCVTKELSEVYMEEVTARLEHDVVVVTITDSEQVGDHAVAGAGPSEVVHSLLQLVRAGVLEHKIQNITQNVAQCLTCLASQSDWFLSCTM